MNELREEFTKYAHLGYGNPDELVDAVMNARAVGWIITEISRDLRGFLRPIATSTLISIREESERARRSAARAEGDRTFKERTGLTRKQSADQWREREAATRAELGLPADASALTVLNAQCKVMHETIFAEGWNAALDEFMGDLLARHHVPGVGWRRRGELTRDHCRILSNDKADRAESALRDAAFFANLADRMDMTGATKVSELGAVTA